MRMGQMLRFLLMAACLAAAAARAEEASRRFLWEEAHATMAAAQTPEDYLKAARAYNRLVQDGVRNGPLFFDLGTALLLAGDAPNAIAALERAERYLGSTSDIRANLRLACAAKTRQPDADLPWSRMAFFWHFDQPVRVRAVIALAGWTLLWLGLLVRLLAGRRRGPSAAADGPARVRSLGGSCAAFGALIGLVFGASALLSYVQERLDDRAWPERVFVSKPVQEGMP